VPNGAGRAGGSSLPSSAAALARLVGNLNWNLLALLSDLRCLSGRGFQAAATALFGEQCGAGDIENVLPAGHPQALLPLRAPDRVPLAVVRSELFPLETASAGDEVKHLRAAARRRYRELEMSLVRAFSRARRAGTVDPFEGVTLLKQTCQLSRASLRPSADELAARLADGVVRLNLATLALVRELPGAGADGLELAGQLAQDGDSAALLRLLPRSRVSEALLFLVAVSSPPLSSPHVERLRGLSLGDLDAGVEAAGRESRDRVQTLLAEFIRLAEEDTGWR